MGLIKSEKEIRFLKKAAEISNSCIPLIEKSLHEKISEKELTRRVRKKINSQGATLSFQTLCASSDRTSMIHPKPHATDRIISGIGYIDFGASYKGYKADVTVPFIKGKINREETIVVKKTLEAYKLSVKSVKIGVPFWKVHEATDKFLRKNGFEMKHALGHGLGLKVHDSPLILKPRKKLKGKKKKRWERIKKINFQPKMVFTIEPGIYTKKFGSRIENDFLITKEGKLKQLTKSRLIKV